MAKIYNFNEWSSKINEQADSKKTDGVNTLKKLSNISLDIMRNAPVVNANIPLAKLGTEWVSCLWGADISREPGTFWSTAEPSPTFGKDIYGVTGNCRIVLNRWGKSTYYVIGTKVGGTIANPKSTGKTVIYKFGLNPNADKPGEETARLLGTAYPGDSFASTFGNLQKAFFNDKQNMEDGSKEFKAIMDSLIHLKAVSLPKLDEVITQAFPNWNSAMPWIRDYVPGDGKASGWNAYSIYLTIKSALPKLV